MEIDLPVVHYVYAPNFDAFELKQLTVCRFEQVSMTNFVWT